MAIEPLTAREALLEIRRIYAKGRITDDMLVTLKHVDAVAEAGLSRTAPSNFVIDQLADRLAEAHAELRRIKRDGFPNGPRDARHIDGILALPPDLEAMVERRIGPPR